MKTFSEISCWDGYKKQGTKPGTGKNKGKQVNNCVPEKKVEEDAPGNAVGQGGVNMAPNAGPRLKVMNVTDRRRRKDKQPVMLKRFRQHAEVK